MSSALSNYDGVDDQRNNNTPAESTVVRLLRYERLRPKRDIEPSKSNDHSGPETIVPIDVESPVSQQGLIALRCLNDALDYAQQLGLCRWEFAEEIDSLRQHGLANGDLRWFVCNGIVEHGREITELGEEGRKFHHDRGLSFSSETCFVLTEHGASHVRRWLDAPADDSDDDPNELLTPKWDSELQELRVGTTIIKRFKVPARNQETVLAAFQEEGWPVFLDDPLPPHLEIDPKRRLHDTINSLNRNQKNDLIRFRGNGSGEGIRWELIRPPESMD
jgi:hypothetical protein